VASQQAEYDYSDSGRDRLAGELHYRVVGDSGSEASSWVQ
jgi:hypothetical protein